MGKMSRVLRCNNCGEILQSDNINSPGYIPTLILKDTNRILYCENCYQKRKVNRGELSSSIDDNSFKILSDAKNNNSLIVLIIDIFAFNGVIKKTIIDLIKDVSPEDILLCERVITYIKEQSNKEIDDSIYVTLTDHIINMIDRIRMGIDFDSAILLNIKSLYKQEYYIALQVVKILRKELNMKIDDSEASFITLHIVNAEMSSNMMQMYEVTTIMEGILGIVRNEFNITENNSDSYDRFITHCRFFVQRVVNREYLDKDPSTYEQMFKVMLDLYKKQYSCVHKIADYIEKKYNYLVEDDERMYLLIHLVKLTS